MSIRTRRKPMRAVAAAVAAAVGASLLAISGPTSVGATPSVTVSTRISGADRYATANAVALAAATGRTNITAAVLVSGENFPDGLAAASLAGALNAPMLLTQAAALPTSVLATLTTIKATNTNLANIVIVGGTTAVSADVATQLTALGYTITRIAGDDRYATANAVAAATRTNNGATIGTFGASNLRTAFLANGANFPDALAASAQAYKGKHPIFLTNGTTLTAETAAAITAAGVQQVLILGGTSAVSAEVATAVAGVTGVVASSRVEGADRYATATALATALGAADATFKSRAYLVNGTNFPDALVAAQLAGGTNSGAIIPLSGETLPAAVSTWITANQATLGTIRAIGGTDAVPAAAVTAVQTGATTAPLSATITALDGGAGFSVVFSAAVDSASAQLATNYRVTSALGTSKAPATGTYTAATNTVVVPVTGGIAAGDVIQVLPNSVVSSVTAGLYVAAASATVAADTTAPTITVVAYPTTVGAVPSDPSAARRVWVTLGSSANIATGASIATQLNSMTFTGAQIGSSAAAFSNNFTQIGATRTWVGGYTTAVVGGFVAGGTLTLAAGKVTSSASTPVPSAATTATLAADATGPSISSVRFTQSGTATGAVQARAVVGGEVTISARATTAVDGKAGNLVDVQTVVNPALAAAPTCTYTGATNTVTISAATTTSALVLANACNLTPSFNALFAAAASTAGGLSGYANAVADFSGGLDLVTLTLTTSEAIDPAATIVGLTAAGVLGGTLSNVAISAAVSTADAQSLAGSFTITANTAGTVIASVTTVALAASVKDRAQNAASTTAVVVTAA